MQMRPTATKSAPYEAFLYLNGWPSRASLDSSRRAEAAFAKYRARQTIISQGSRARNQLG